MSSIIVNDIHAMVWLMDQYADVFLQSSFSISYRKFYMLAMIKEIGDGTLSQHDVARSLAMSDAAASKALRQLARHGLVSLKVDQRHARRRVVTLTSESRKLVDIAMGQLEQKFRKILVAAEVDSESYLKNTNAITGKLREVRGLRT